MGSQLVSIPASRNGSEKLAVFLPEDPETKSAQHVMIIVPGKLSNAGLYWERLRNVSEGLYGTQFNRTNRKILNVSPILFSERFTPGLRGDDQLSWATPRGWIAGLTAAHPAGTRLTSVDALEALVDEFSKSDKYPMVTNITFVGQSAGGQLIQRYAAVARDRPSSRIHIRYIQNNPATCAYFTSQRPTNGNETLPSKADCRRSNTWPFGYHNFPGTATGTKSPMEYFRQYITRDVVATVGYKDTNPCSGDQTCRAVMLGGHKRRDRNLIWHRYINELARTNEDLTGFPGQFTGLPDWSSVSHYKVNLRLVVAKNEGHEFQDIFTTDVGLSALFDDDNIMEGYRPSRI
ncbi:hypothetical protein QQS21_008224 [Conoideocrella luteorostrata]|uniref:Transmembrane protein n=1 Tax=Conoideocrella luteorostrata TaxID=1105319 RepID=A0AAJ0FYV3_9HYPO|nr:hypothetical protein QQS21_008224 [Conoideocrella luteorostrata]